MDAYFRAGIENAEDLICLETRPMISSFGPPDLLSTPVMKQAQVERIGMAQDRL
jgi:hypothetical protein